MRNTSPCIDRTISGNPQQLASSRPFSCLNGIDHALSILFPSILDKRRHRPGPDLFLLKLRISRSHFCLSLLTSVQMTSSHKRCLRMNFGMTLRSNSLALPISRPQLSINSGPLRSVTVRISSGYRSGITGLSATKTLSKERPNLRFLDSKPSVTRLHQQSMGCQYQSD